MMRYFRNIRADLFIVILAVVTITGCSQSDKSATKGAIKYSTITWPMLIPPNWDENSLLNNIDLSKMQDNDPKAFELLKKVREGWNNAPVVESWDGKAVTISGYPVPLDGNTKFIKELLLVPYFGGCIHTPPPPSNQVIHIYLNNTLPIPYDNLVMFTTSYGGITVKGVLKVAHSSSALGEAGYQMEGKIIAPIEEQATPMKE